jgi:putative glutamine amidotransferase
MHHKHKQPIIGITMKYDNGVLVREGVDYSIIRREYGEEVRAAGGQPIFLDGSIDPEVAVGMCDGIVITGGEDIDPSLYRGQQLLDHALEPVERTLWERKLIDACDKKRIRILGVCYGSQLLNVHYGGTLYQDIAAEAGSSMFHGSSAEQAMHRVKFAADFLSFQKNDFVETAHRHHQAVKVVAPGFTPVAQAEDGIVEAIAGHGHFGIQWHAESDGTASDIYGAFVALCAGKELETHGHLSPLPEAV